MDSIPNQIGEDEARLAASFEQIATFAGRNLASTIAKVEFEISGLNSQQISKWLKNAAMDDTLVSSARAIKRAAAQIDVVLHVLGIVLALPAILESGETVEALSLGAGSSKEKRFDVETDRRIAEFTFIEWRGNDNTRLQKIFKDFYRLSEFETKKLRELWVTDDTYVLKYLRSRSSIRSATHKSRDVWEDISTKYPTIKTVSDYYRLNATKVALKVLDRDLPSRECVAT
jgi:hypothetical protein